MVSWVTYFCIMPLKHHDVRKKATATSPAASTVFFCFFRYTVRRENFSRWQWLRRVDGNHNESPAILRDSRARFSSRDARVNSSRNFGHSPGWIFKILHGPREHPPDSFFFHGCRWFVDDNYSYRYLSRRTRRWESVSERVRPRKFFTLLWLLVLNLPIYSFRLLLYSRRPYYRDADKYVTTWLSQKARERRQSTISGSRLVKNSSMIKQLMRSNIYLYW